MCADAILFGHGNVIEIFEAGDFTTLGFNVEYRYICVDLQAKHKFYRSFYRLRQAKPSV